MYFWITFVKHLKRGQHWAQLFSRVWLLVAPGTVAHEAALSMGFSRQEYWSKLPFPSPGDLSNLGIEPRSPALQVDYLPAEPQGKPSASLEVSKLKGSLRQMATHSSILAWKIPWIEEPGGLQFIESHRVWHYWAQMQHNLSTNHDYLQGVGFLIIFTSFFIFPTPISSIMNTWCLKRDQNQVIWFRGDSCTISWMY